MLLPAGNWASACKSYLRALEINTGSPAAWNSLSMAFVAAGQFPLADLADQHDLIGIKKMLAASPEPLHTHE